MSPVRSRGRAASVERPKPPFLSRSQVLVVLRQESARSGNVVTQRAFLEAIKKVQELEYVDG